MSTKHLLALVMTVIAAITGCAVLAGGGFGAGCASGNPSAETDTAAGFDAEQTGNAATIVAVGQRLKVPPRGWVIAVATAIQESSLRNLPGGDRDSIGLFQQRPSQGWGTPDQLHDPAYAATAFYQRLLTVAGWQNMALTDAAQAVQRSAYPDAYAQHEPAATALVSAASGGIIAGGPCVDAATAFARARTWLTAWNGGPVPYLSSGNPTDWYQGYRRDCSGYVSMALGLPGPGLTTAELAAKSTPITQAELQPGDLLINPAPNLNGHVVLFERWTDPSMNSYWGYEQSGDGGTHYRKIPYPYYGGYLMSPFHFKN